MSGEEREIDRAADYILAFAGIAVPVGAAGYLIMRLTCGIQSATAAILAIILAAVSGIMLAQVRMVRRLVADFFSLLMAPFV